MHSEALREGRAAAAPRRGRLRPELLRAVRAGCGAARRRRRRAASSWPPTARRRRAWPPTSRCTSIARCPCCRRAACCTAPTWRRPRTWSASASRRSPRWPPAAWSSPRPWPCSSASCRSSCSRGRSSSRLGDEVSFDAVVASSGDARLRARRAGARARRVRRARRAHRRVPGARRPAARRVLGRRGGEPAHLLGVLAAHHRRPRAARRSTPRSRPTRPCPSTRRACTRRIAAWEREGREEAPDELFRRAGVRALAALAGRFTTVADVLAAAGLGGGRVQPGRDLPGAGRLRRRGRHGGRRARACASGSTCRSPRPAPCSPAPCRSTSCSATSRCSSTPRGRSSRRATSPAPSATCCAWCATATASSSSSATRARRSAPPTGCATCSAEVVSREQLARGGEAAPGLYFLAAPLRDGFVAADLKLAVVNERSLLRAAPREQRFAGGTRLTTFFDVRPGDYVVHEDHGIARFAGIETRTVAGVTRDYLLLEFRGDDRVFVPHDQIGKVSRYIGASGATPSLDKLGGTHWQTVKTRARKAVVEMAGELLQLYAARQAIPGYAFPPDGELTRRLEDAFPFEETEDQAEAIDEVKNDMEAPHPMDRLICGDVGYGKTEVALRAAFKAAEAGKQTLVLVPTTILAEQHYMTFSERYADLPVKVGMVSRFRTARRAAAHPRRLQRRQARRAHRHPPPAQHRRAAARPGAGRRRRGAALRRAPEGAAAQPQAAGRRDEPLGDAHPAHPADVAHRHPRHLRHRDAAARPPRDPHLHRRVPRRPGAHRHREGARPRGPGVLPAQPRGDHRPGGRARARAGAVGAHPRGARADARARPGEGDARLPRRRGRRAGHDVDHRERHRHPQRQHARRGARRHARPGAALPDPRAHRAQRRARLRLPALPERGAADQRRGGAPADAERPHRPGRRLQDRHGRPRDPRRRQPARRRAERARGRGGLRDVRADARGGRAASCRASRRRWRRRCASTCP